ncbi:MAG: flagellar basal body L-ring protein FlgH [Epsilonproteobacteria bacterium]|nr:flagellar basal body L-ring protein FlgH [Campylobacterota bacterium]
MRKYLMIVAVGVGAISCSTPVDPSIDLTPPKYVEQMPSKEEEQSHNLGSLFNNGDNLFSDKKAMKVNDIVTVIITEEVKASSTGKAQTSEVESVPTVGFNMALGAVNHVTGLAGKNIGLNDLHSPSIDMTRNFQGQGTNTREDKFTATVTARIIKVLKNGNYFIAGSREVLINGEKNIIRVAGVIRPSDIDSTNTIDSKYISDARIEYKTEGEISKATDKNWLAKILDTISPF